MAELIVEPEAEAELEQAGERYEESELVHRRDPARRFLLEIVGFWTPRYLEEKLRKLRQAKLDNVILCIDEARACSDASFPPHATIVRYKRRIDVSSVLAVLERPSPDAADAAKGACWE